MSRSCSFLSRTSRSLMPTMSSLWPVNVVPRTATTPMVFSSRWGCHVLGADRVLALGERHDPRLDVEVAAELLPHDVDVAAEDEVGPVGRQAGRLAAAAPLPLQRQRAEHDRLGRALGARAGRLARRVEEVGEHAHAALLDLGGARVLRVVDEVAVQVLGDDPLRLRLHPGRDERGQVARRVTLEREVLVHEPHGVGRGHPVLGERRARHLLGGEAVAEEGGVGVGREGTGHALLLGGGR